MQTGRYFSQMGLQYLIKLGRRSGWMSLVVWLMAMAPAQANLELRVAIEERVNQVTVGGSTPTVVKNMAGEVIEELPAMGAVSAIASQGTISLDNLRTNAVWIEPSGDGLVFIGDKWYRGRALLAADANGVTAVNYVDLEQYLYSVVGGEMPTNWHTEALKAQAVAARTYVLYQRQTSSNRVFDVGDTTRWQVYRGVEEEAASTIAAVDATEGQVLTYNGQLIEAVFHSSSGGCTENVEEVWSSPRPYLRSVQDYDQGAPVYQWTAAFTADQLRQRITGVGNVLRFVPERVTRSCGRIISMRVEGDAGSRVLSGAELRDALGLRSTFFNVQPVMGSVASTRSVASIPTQFQVSGQGFGHGLGMSQWGAFALAQNGNNYHQIVQHYYSNAVLSVIRVE